MQLARTMTKPVLVFGIFCLFAWNEPVASTVFQGACKSDRNPICDQICVDKVEGTFACDCRPGYRLLEDGLTCWDLNSKITVTRPKTRRKNRKPPTIANTNSASTPPSILPNSSDGYKFNVAKNVRSYLAFDAPDSMYLRTNISVEFAISSAKMEDGLLLFGGQKNGGRDHIAVSFRNGNLIFRFDCGEGTVEEVYDGPFEPNVWHRATIIRRYCSHAEMQVDRDGVRLISDKNGLYYKGISISRYIYLGGMPPLGHLGPLAPTQRSFGGCVRYLEINSLVLLDAQNDINTAKESHAVTECSNSQVVPLRTEHEHENNDKYDQAQSITSLTTQVALAALDNSADGAQFAGTSFVRLRSSLLATSPSLAVALQLRPTEHTGLLFYAGDNATEHRHYVAVFLKDGHVHYRLDLGWGAVTIRSEQPIATRRWHTVEFWRTGRGALLKVDGQNWVEGVAPEPKPKRGSVSAISGPYIGWTPETLLPPSLRRHVVQGFHGCIRKVVLNDVAVSFARDAQSLTEVRECGADPCVPTPCQGTASKCLLHHDHHLCLCAHPRTGDKCQVNGKPVKQIGFNGRGYLKFTRPEIMKHITGDRLNLHIQFRLTPTKGSKSEPLVNDQVLASAGSSRAQSQLWHETEAEGEGDGDHLRLFVDRRRRITAAVQLGSGPILLSLPAPDVDDGHWHRVLMKRLANHLELSYDDREPIRTSGSPASTQLNVYDAFYLAGHGTDPGHGLRGCVRLLQLDTVNITDVGRATDAFNVQECS